MRIAALVLGIIGGIFGIFGSLFATMVGGLGAAFNAKGASEVAGLGFVAVFISIAGLVGGALALKYPKVAGWMMLLCGISGIIAISAGYIIAGPLFIIGGILALISSRKSKKTDAAAA